MKVIQENRGALHLLENAKYLQGLRNSGASLPNSAYSLDCLVSTYIM